MSAITSAFGGDLVTPLAFTVYGLGTPGAANTEFGRLAWDSVRAAYVLSTDSSGSGAQRPLLVYANGVYFRPFGVGNTTAQLAHTSSGLENNAQITASAATATPAGGSATMGLKQGSAGVGEYIGTGAPTLSAAKGSTYRRTDATTTTTRFYINTDGGTTWTNFTTAA